MAITNATYTSPDWKYAKYPLSVSPIPDDMRQGMIALSVISLVSCLSTFGLLVFLTYRLWTSRKGYDAPMYKNQYIILIYSLVLSDFQLGLGFFLEVAWIKNNAIISPSSTCWAQGWLVNIGDLGSGFFVLAIGVHTFMSVVLGKRLDLRTVVWASVALWLFAFLLTTIPPVLHPSDMFTASGNWCSIAGKYDKTRLFCHYIWVLIAEGLVLLAYLTTFVVVRKRLSVVKSHMNTHNSVKAQKVSNATMYMVLYPLIYVVTTLPLAAFRLASLAGNPMPRQYLMAGGCVMASGGALNCLLYTLTRRIFLIGKSDTSAHARYASYGGRGSVLRSGGDIELSKGVSTPASRYRELPSPLGSTDEIVALERTDQATGGFHHDRKGGVTMETSWEVRSERVYSAATKVPPSARLGNHAFVDY
ncbi:uncharacterized protein BP5553_00837 [Venustampulla echinocandica]|uniref:G-protein coupled receptors family 1 profile domain-containing protein n=1 Tax=Venustampulla echinocandica TaxID=2656787 RepID=A0A370TZE1_9HELO|nr:uncharacterized protein BP5553_00837 [Venustampulla echinocandica]RDL40858.1 hypothetical protein BP5553_00837 [Venustampulla echinocandica]